MLFPPPLPQPLGAAETAALLLRKGIELVAGGILLVGGYAAVVARRADTADRRKRYRRIVLQTITAFFLLAYATAVLVPYTQAWPVELGLTLRQYFTNIETVPSRANTEITVFYTALEQKMGVATGAATTTSGIFAEVEKVVRVVGLVTYTLFVSLASLSAQVPGRAIASLQNVIGQN